MLELMCEACWEVKLSPTTIERQLAACGILTAAALLFVPATFAQESPSAKALRFFQEGRGASMAGHNLEAIKSLSQALDESPNYVDALIQRGIAYEQIGQFNEAIADQSRAIVIKPDNYVAYYNRANEEYKQKQYGEALQDYRKVSQLLPQKTREMEVCLATVYEASGDPVHAAEHYAAAERFGKDIDLESKRLACLSAVKAAALNNTPDTGMKSQASPYGRIATTSGAHSRAKLDPVVSGAAPDVSDNRQLCFLTQLVDPRWNPNGPQTSNNCGPACLAMAYKYFGVPLPGNNPKDPEKFIEATRMLMTGINDNIALTNFDDVLHGAEPGGLRTRILRNFSEIDKALADGAVFIASGCPNLYGSYGERFNYKVVIKGHFILVTGKDGANYRINDPLNKDGPVLITQDELKAYLGYWPSYALKGGIAIWK